MYSNIKVSKILIHGKIYLNIKYDCYYINCLVLREETYPDYNLGIK